MQLLLVMTAQAGGMRMWGLTKWLLGAQGDWAAWSCLRLRCSGERTQPTAAAALLLPLSRSQSGAAANWRFSTRGQVCPGWLS